MDELKKIKLVDLLALKSKIHEFLHYNKNELNDIKTSNNVPFEWVINYADNISLTLSAPKNWTPGFPLINSHVPAPQLIEMRDGLMTSNIKDKSEEIKSAVYIQPDLPKNSGPTRRQLKRKSEENLLSSASSQPIQQSSPVVVAKKARQINISFGLSDSDSD
jgi:hypothetical protein